MRMMRMMRVMRVVTYPLKRVEGLHERLANEPEKLNELAVRSHSWLRARLGQ